MKQKKSLAQNGSRKKAALIGCSIAGTAVLMAGAGVGVGYIVFNKPGQAGYEVETNKSGLYESDKDDEVKISVVLDHKNIDGAEFDIIQADSWVECSKDPEGWGAIISWKPTAPSLDKTQFVQVTSKVNGVPIDTRSIALIPSSDGNTVKSLSAVINGSLQVGSNADAWITVESHNGARLPDGTTDPMHGFVFSEWEKINDIKAQTKVQLDPTNPATTGSTVTFDVDKIEADVYIPVAPAAATKSLSAVINHSLQIGDTNPATITVKSFNGAQLPTGNPVLDGFAFDAWSDPIGNEVTINVYLTTATSGESWTIPNTDSITTQVYIPVIQTATPYISAVIDHSLQIGDTNPATITVTCFNGAMPPYILPSLDGFAFDSWTYPVGGEITIQVHLDGATVGKTLAIADGNGLTVAKVYIPVTKTAEPSLSAVISGPLQVGESTTAAITVTSFNGAQLPSGMPTLYGFYFNDWVQVGNKATNTVQLNGATNGSPFTISGGDSTTTQVYIPVAPAAATKSLSAVINGSLQVGTSDTATITVKSFNGATLPTLTDDFIGVGFSFNNIIVNSDEVTVEVGLTTATEGAIVAIIGGGASTTVYIPVAPAAATKSLSAGIDGALIVGGEGKATIWVKGFNGATMPSDVLAYEGFSFSVWRQEGNPNESFCDVTWAGATEGVMADIIGDDDAQTQVYIPVAPDETVYDWFITEDDTFFDDAALLDPDTIHVMDSSLKWNNSNTSIYLDLKRDVTYANAITLKLPTCFQPADPDAATTVTAFFQVATETSGINWIQQDLTINTSGQIVFPSTVNTYSWAEVVLSGNWVSSSTPPGPAPK